MLKKRIISGTLLIASLLVAANYLPPVGAWIVIVAISCLAQLEFYTMMNRAGIPVFRVIGLLSGTALISATFCNTGPAEENLASAYKWEMLVLIFSIIVVFVRQFPQKSNDKPLETIGCTLLGVLYVSFLFDFFTRLAFAWDGTSASIGLSDTGKMLILFLVIVVKSTDVGAFFTGRMIGKHKLFPRISPAKTWEGLVGGVLTGILASCIFCLSTNFKLGAISLQMQDALILGFLLAIVGAVGDMFESLIKRASGTKDSSALIPGMGGLLDVLDSLLFGAPVLYIYAVLFL